jgi:hypothetical protein
MQQQALNASLTQEQAALQQDQAAERTLRTQLGEPAYAAWFAPPPRAQLVAHLRQAGLEAGLQEFALTLAPALPATAATTPAPAALDAAALIATPLSITASAADDRALYAFMARAVEPFAGTLRLDNFTLHRPAATLSAASPTLIQANLTFRWLALPEAATDTSVPEAAIDISAPEAATDTSVPEAAMDISVPEAATNISAPEPQTIGAAP